MESGVATPAEEPFKRDDVYIPSKRAGWRLHAWRYLPLGSTSYVGKLPVIVMAPDLAMCRRHGLAQVAEAFATAGYAVIVFDYRRWGASDGVPRHILFVTEQLEDYRAVIKYCQQQQLFDSHKIVLWGSGLAGGHVISLSAERRLNLAAVVAQRPFLGKITRGPWTMGYVKTTLIALVDAFKQAFGGSPVYIPAYAPIGSVGLVNRSVTDLRLCQWTSHAETGNKYPNEVAASAVFEIPVYNPGSDVPSITCPVFLSASQKDELFPFETAVQVTRQAPRKMLTFQRVLGDHFALHSGPDANHALITQQLHYLQKHISC